MTLNPATSRPLPGNQIAVNLSAFHRLLAGLLLLTALGLTATVPVSADVYRWVDANGTVNYGEREPRGHDFTVVSRSAPTPKKPSVADPYSGNGGKSVMLESGVATPTSGVAAGDNSNLSDHQKAMLDRLQADEAQRQENIAELRKSNCATSKRVLSQMQSRGRIRVRNDAGEETALSDDDRNERIRQAQESISVNCDSFS